MTETVSSAVAVAPTESVACTVIDAVAMASGVPEISPDEESASPAGNVPAASDQESAPVPPLPDNCCE